MHPPVSPLPPLVSLVLRPLPLLPLEAALSILLRKTLQLHPTVFDRLGPHAGKRFGLDPTDLPFALVIETSRAAARILVVRRLPVRRPDAVIRGPFGALVGMVDGAYDGDALFFSRAISVEGDIEAVLALRNAVDDAGIDLVRALASGLGPFSRSSELLLRRALEVGRLALRPGGVSQRDGVSEESQQWS